MPAQGRWPKLRCFYPHSLTQHFHQKQFLLTLNAFRMKKLILGICFILLSIFTFAQTIKGKVTDAATGSPVNGATIDVEGAGITTTNESGLFYMAVKKGTYTVNITNVGFKKLEEKLSPSSTVAEIKLQRQDLFLQEVEIKAVRASEKSPFTKTNISKKEIEKNNLGQDLPYLLNQSPSVVVNSDAGNGVGYTGIHIRGTDATRINVTLNGIPYNDAESQGTYFVDLPDVASSLNSIQIQRGVGTSTNGSGAFGATINLSTNEFNDKPYGEINNSFGSFNTWKNTVKAGSGLINDHFTIDARLSRITSDGYIDRASSNLQSLYLSGAYINNKTSVRFNLIKGKEKTYQAWNGVPETLLYTDRTYNSCGTEKPGEPYNNQTDNYDQDHYQLFVNQELSKTWSLNVASFLTRGKGYYEEYKAQQPFSKYGLPDTTINGAPVTQTDLVRQRWLDNYFYGQVLSFQHKSAKDEVTIGGGWTEYDGKHYGDVIWAQVGIPKDYRYYNYPAVKKDQNVYVKWLHELNANWNLFGDMQYRHVYHRMEGFEDFPEMTISRQFDFFNPKAGISYNRNGYNAYFSFAMAGKEPNRDDFQANPSQQPKREQLQDFELGMEKKSSWYSYGATLYYMNYKDQLVLTGQMNDVGAYVRVNVPNSYRAGIELQGSVVVNNWMNIHANVAFSKNKIKSFDAYFDDYDNSGEWVKQIPKEYKNTDISFSPSIIAGGTINFIPAKFLMISLPAKFVGKQYLDNTQDETRRLGDYYSQNVMATFTIKHLLFSEWNIIGQVNNVFNKRFETNGAAYATMLNGTIQNDNYYFPNAGTNFMVGVNVKL